MLVALLAPLLAVSHVELSFLGVDCSHCPRKFSNKGARGNHYKAWPNGNCVKQWGARQQEASPDQGHEPPAATPGQQQVPPVDIDQQEQPSPFSPNRAVTTFCVNANNGRGLPQRDQTALAQLINTKISQRLAGNSNEVSQGLSCSLGSQRSLPSAPDGHPRVSHRPASYHPPCLLRCSSPSSPVTMWMCIKRRCCWETTRVGPGLR